MSTGLVPLSYQVSTAYLTKAVDKADTGTGIGLDHASRSLCGLIAPVAGGYIVREFGYDAVSIVTAIFAAAALMFWLMVARFSNVIKVHAA